MLAPSVMLLDGDLLKRLLRYHQFWNRKFLKLFLIVNFYSELTLKSLKTKDAKKCKLIQQKKWFVLVVLAVVKMLARVTQEIIHLSEPSTEPWLKRFGRSILKKVDHWSANITVASFLPVLHLGELAVHEQNILGNGPKVFYAFTDIWIIDIIRII